MMKPITANVDTTTATSRIGSPGMLERPRCSAIAVSGPVGCPLGVSNGWYGDPGAAPTIAIATSPAVAKASARHPSLVVPRSCSRRRTVERR
jgi:hypothetical protein